MSAALDAVREALRDRPAWLVGGAVRDRLMHRPVRDVDVVVAGDVRATARLIALSVGGPSFALSDAFGAWRVIGPGREWQVDLTPLRGDSIEADLGLRDFTVNAIAEPLHGGALIDPHGGADDLAAHRLRMVSARAFADDPLRAVRLARFGCELDLEPDAATIAAARERADGIESVAPERVFAELKRIVAADRALDGLELLDRVGATAVVLPELHAMRGVEQNRFHHLDVHDHTLAVLQAVSDLQRDPAPIVGEAHADAIGALLAEPFADELTRGEALRWGALLHDVAKPATRDVTTEGRVTFIGHDEQGAALARDVLARLRTSERLRVHVAALARHHLRLGFLVHHRPLDRRAIYRYLTACAPVEVDVTLLSIADRLATRGDNAHDAIAAHLELAREMLGEALEFSSRRREPLVRGDALADALGVTPGRQLGELLAAIDEAHFAGEVSTPDEAIALAGSILSRP
jgi:putative nucleotidyltransferase with HDIG domain